MSEPAPRSNPVLSFKSGLTTEVLSLTALNLGIGAFVTWTGWHANQMWPGKHRGDAFELIGLLLLAVCAVVPWRRLGQSVRLSETSFTYKNGNVTTRIPWETMSVYQAPKSGRKWFRHALIGDDKTQVTLDSQSFKELDAILKIVGEVRKRNRPFD